MYVVLLQHNVGITHAAENTELRKQELPRAQHTPIHRASLQAEGSASSTNAPLSRPRQGFPFGPCKRVLEHAGQPMISKKSNKRQNLSWQ